MEMECKQPLYFHKLKFEINIPVFIHNHEGQSTNSETETTKRVNKEFNIMITLFAHIPFTVKLECFAFAYNSFNCGPSPRRVTTKPKQPTTTRTM